MEYNVDFFRKELMRAMKEKNVVKKEVLTLIVAEMKNREIDSKTNLTENDILSIIRKQIKRIEEAISMANGRDTVIQEGQVAYLKTLLPVEYTEDEIMSIVKKLCNGAANKGQIMKTIMPVLNGKADNRLISKCVDKFLEV